METDRLSEANLTRDEFSVSRDADVLAAILAKEEGAGQQAQEGGGDGGRKADGTGGFVTDVATGAALPPPHK